MAKDGNGLPLGFGGATAFLRDYVAHFYRGESEMSGVLDPRVAGGLR